MSVELWTGRRLGQSRSESIPDRKGGEVPDLDILYVPQAALNITWVRSDERWEGRGICAQLVPDSRPSLLCGERSKRRRRYY